jgi:cell division cycle 20, cofactor of APC complex
MEFVTPPTTPKKVRGLSHMGKSPTLRSPNKSLSEAFLGFDYNRSQHGIENKPNRSFLEPKSPIRTQERKRALDRFIPSREAMDFDAINNELMSESDREDSESDISPNTPSQANYKKRLDLLKNRQDGDKILSFSADKKSLSPLGDKPSRMLDLSSPGSTFKSKQGPRSLPTCPSRVLDAPELLDDYYLNLLSWSKDNIIAIALKNALYLWNASDGSNQKLMTLDGPDDVITSVQWSGRDSILSVGTNTNAVQLWDVSKSVCVRQMGGHTSRVSALSWKDSLLTSGGRDSIILNHDTRARNHVQFKYAGHQQEVCGLKWSPDGTTLASGG